MILRKSCRKRWKTRVRVEIYLIEYKLIDFFKEKKDRLIILYV